MYLKESVFVGSLLLNFTSVFVSLGVFIFGFEQGVMSSLLTNKYFKQYYNEPTPFEIGTMIAILEVGALFSSVVAGKVGDKIGRRRTIRYGAFIFAFGGLIQATSFNIFTLSSGRLISGIAIGLLTTIIPCYQSEISPPEDRGFYGCLEFSGNIVGYSLSIWVDYAFSFVESNVSWRSPLFVQFLIGTLLWSGSFVIVETPRWLLDHNHDCEGMIVIADLYADGDILDDHAKSEYRNIKESVLLARIEGGERSYRYLFTKYTKRLSVACFSQMFAQMNGINIISYYAPMIFESAGWKGRQAILMTGINSIIYFLATIPPWFLVDDWGRKPLLMSGALLMGIPLYVVAWSLWKNDEHTPSIVVVSIIITNAAFGYSWGPIPWLMSEVFPNSVRSKGAAMSTATNWLFNFIVGEMTPILLDLIQWRTYIIPATSCMLSFFCVHFLFPETKGLNLEDMGSVFDDNSSVFSFHSSGVRSNDELRSRSFSVDTSAMNQTAASLARNPANMAYPDGIIGSIPSIPVPSSVSGKLDSSSDVLVSDNIPVEVEPPSPEDILKFKKEEKAKTMFSFLFSRHEQSDETSRLLA
jgi:sugar porter (SP) family MFS transporter